MGFRLSLKGLRVWGLGGFRGFRVSLKRFRMDGWGWGLDAIRSETHDDCQPEVPQYAAL